MTKLVVVDPGHGGDDPGAVGNGLREAALTLRLAKRVRTVLVRDFDVQVKLTRASDRTVGLSERAAFANRLGADFFISLHLNSNAGTPATGYEDFVHTSAGPTSKAAKHRAIVHDAVVDFLRQHDVRDRGRKAAGLAVLRETAMPAVLTENLFINNPDDARLLAKRAFLRGLADAHARGIAEALRLPQRS